MIQYSSASSLADSLRIIWNNEKDPTRKFEAGKKLLWRYINNDLEKAAKFSDTLLVYGEQRGGFDHWEAHFIKTEILKRKGKEDEALEIVQFLESQAIENKWDRHLARAWNAKGELYEGLQNWKQTVFYYKKAADFFAETDARRQIMILSNLADAYVAMGDIITGKDVNLEMLEIAEREFDPQVLEHILEWSKELDNNYNKSCLYSVDELDEILKYAHKTDNIRTALHFFLSKMDCLFATGKYEKLLKTGEEVQQDFESYGDLHINISFFRIMEKTYAAQRQWEKSYKVLEKQDSLKLILFNKEKEESIAQRTLNAQKIENERLERETANVIREQQQTKNNNRWRWLLVLSLLLGLFLFLVQRETKQKLEKKQLEHQIWQLQFNPHFFFNALTSIQAFLYEQNPNKAIKAINRLAGMFRQTLSRSELEWIDLNSELDFLQEYVVIHKFMSGDEFEFEIRMDESLRKKEIQVPPFLFQPIVENAIKHGFKGECAKDNKLYVELEEKKGGIKINIRNNGHEFKTSTCTESSSLGMRITDKRLYSYKQGHKGMKIENSLIDEENWVEVSFLLPLHIQKQKQRK